MQQQEVLLGIGFGANMVIACVYPLEFVGRQWRVLCGTIGFWSLGSMALAGFVSTIRRTPVLRLSARPIPRPDLIKNYLYDSVKISRYGRISVSVEVSCQCEHILQLHQVIDFNSKCISWISTFRIFLKAYWLREWTHLTMVTTSTGVLLFLTLMWVILILILQTCSL